MPAFHRTIAQRNNNITQIVPQFVDILPSSDISGAALYNLNISNVQFTNGVYFVDMSGADSTGTLLDISGLFYPFVLNGDTLQPISIVTFALNVQAAASNYPGLELTIFFKNLPLNRLFGMIPLLTIGIVINSGIPVPYIVSPPFPSALGANISPSITLKSDGTSFNVVSSGPAGWMGIPALSVILAAYNDMAP